MATAFDAEQEFTKKYTAGYSYNEDIFESFHKNKILLYDLEGACNYFYVTSGEYGVSLAKIDTCDSHTSTSFSKACCHCNLYHSGPQKRGPDGFGLCTLFEYGFDVLESYIQSPDFIPKREGAKIALAKLLTFLQNDKEATENALLKAAESATISERDWTVVVAHHLLSKLAVCSDYKMDVRSQGNVDNRMCPCGCGELYQGRYDDTSIGLPEGWHGNFDVFMEAGISTCESILPDSPTDEELIKRKDLLVASKYKIRAQTIVFALRQQRDHPELQKMLIPTLLVAREQVALFLYDCVMDYLLESPCFKLFKGVSKELPPRVLNQSTVIVIWLSLNYKYFCSGVSEAIKGTQFTADFARGPLINEYRNNVKAPCYAVEPKQWFYLQRIQTVQTKKGREDVNQICRNPKKKQRTE